MKVITTGAGRSGRNDAKLTLWEQARLVALEDVLATSRRWQIEEARALAEIRSRRLYRDRYGSFDEYVERRHGYERAHAHRLAAWGEVLANLSPFGGAVPDRESHARSLAGLAPEQQRQAWKLAQRRLGQRKTAAGIEAVVRDYLNARTPQNAAQAARRATGTVVCGDAIEQLGTLDDGSVAAAIFSPPYCDQRKGHYPGVAEEHYPQWLNRVMAAIRPKLDERGNVLIVAREHMRQGQISDVWLRTRLLLREQGWTECETLVWAKSDAPPLGRADRPRRSFEYVYWFAKRPDPWIDTRACGRPLVEARSRMARNRGRSTLHTSRDFARFRHSVARISDVISIPTGTVTPGLNHPAAYPVPLADVLVRTFSPVDSLVADPFTGSGSTLVAARDAGRHWWGCDIVKRYVDNARQRLSSVA